jgi:type I restriction enzyme, S subunit
VSDLPHGWANARLADLGAWCGGGTPSKSRSEFWIGGSIPWVSPKDMKVHVIADAEDHITEAGVAGSATNVVPASSVLVVVRSGILRRTFPVAVTTSAVALNQDLKALKPIDGIDPHYAAWYLRRDEQSILHDCAKDGTTVDSVDFPALLSRVIPIAPPAEQVRIVAAIDEQFSRLDAGVAALERVRQNIKRMRAAIFEAAVTEWVGTESPQVRLGDVLREPLRNGHSSKADPLGTVPILTLTAVTLGDFGSRNVKMTAADPRRVRNLWIQPGDLLIERSNTRELVGTARLYRGRPNFAVYPDLVIRARVDSRLIPEYAELVLKAPRSRRYFQQRAQGISGTMPKIDQQTIEDLSFVLPSLEIQVTIVEEAERGLTLLASLEVALELLAKRSSSLRSSILAAAFSGKLVPQDASDEPASVLLERIAAERTASDGHKPMRTRKPRAPGEKVTV